MTNAWTIAAKATAALVLAGSLASAGAGAAVAATGPATGATSAAGGHHLRHTSGAERRTLCQREQGRMTLFTNRQHRFAAQTAAFAGLEAKATKAGNTQLATYWAHVVSHRDAYTTRAAARLQARAARDATRHGIVNGSCG